MWKPEFNSEGNARSARFAKLFFFFFRILECVYHGGRYKPKWDFIMLEMQGKYMLPYMVIKKKNPMMVLTDDKIPTRS